MMCRKPPPCQPVMLQHVVPAVGGSSLAPQTASPPCLQISTGLDSSSTFQIVKCMRDFVHHRQATLLMALLQPAPECYDLFDDILLLSEGKLPVSRPLCSLQAAWTLQCISSARRGRHHTNVQAAEEYTSPPCCTLSCPPAVMLRGP